MSSTNSPRQVNPVGENPPANMASISLLKEKGTEVQMGHFFHSSPALRAKPVSDKTTCRICGQMMLCVKRDPRDEADFPFKYDRICGKCMGKI
jgi:hypothetical protein